MQKRHPDHDLVRRLLDGDEEAFDRFVDAFYPRIRRFAASRLHGHPDVVDDVVQQTFGSALPQLHRYRGEASLFSWLCSFCRHAIAAWWRTQSRRENDLPLVDESPSVRAALEALATEGSDPSTRFDRYETARLVRIVLDHLPLNYESALVWKYSAGLTVAEIATRLGVSPKAAESLLSRAREAFRDAFRDVAEGAAR